MTDISRIGCTVGMGVDKGVSFLECCSAVSRSEPMEIHTVAIQGRQQRRMIRGQSDGQRRRCWDNYGVLFAGRYTQTTWMAIVVDDYRHKGSQKDPRSDSTLLGSHRLRIQPR